MSQFIGWFTINLENFITGFYSGFIGRRPLDGRNYCDETVSHGYTNADSGKLALGIELKLFKVIRRQQGRMGIKAVDHTLNSVFDHFFRIDRINIVFFNQFNHIGK